HKTKKPSGRLVLQRCRRVGRQESGLVEEVPNLVVQERQAAPLVFEVETDGGAGVGGADIQARIGLAGRFRRLGPPLPACFTLTDHFLEEIFACTDVDSFVDGRDVERWGRTLPGNYGQEGGERRLWFQVVQHRRYPAIAIR